MFIYTKSSMGNYSLQNLNGNNTIKDLKEEIKKKMKVNVPIIKLRLRNNSGKTLLDDKSLSQSNVSDNTTLILDVKMGAFGEMKKPEIDGEYFDINKFVYDTLDTNDIVFVSWGNAIANPIILTEHKSKKYSNLHNVFRQQLPIPLLEYAVNVNKNINMYSIDKGFEGITEYDIRRIFKKLTKPINISGIELYIINTCELLDELGIDCVYTDSIINYYFIPDIYGFCSNSKENTDIQLCLLELKDNLENLGVEYFIYLQPLDIETLLTNNLKIGNSIKDWFKMDQKGGDSLETIEEEDYCCDELYRCKNDNKRNKRLVNSITKLYEDELLKQMKRGGKKSKRTMKRRMRGGNNDLIEATKRGNIERVRELLDAGVDPNIPDDSGFTPLSIACESVNLDLMKLLLDYGADPNSHNIIDEEPYFGWISGSDEVTSIMKSGIQLLLDAGYDINKIDENGNLVNAMGIDNLVDNDDNIEIVQLLLDNGFVINTPGYNILNEPSDKHAIQMVKFLLDNGADPNIRNQRGPARIPLLVAIQGQDIDIVKLLLASGADPNITEYDQEYAKTPLAFAIDADTLEILKILLDVGADPFQKFKKESYEDSLYNILQYANSYRDRQAATLIESYMVKMNKTQKAKQISSLAKSMDGDSTYSKNIKRYVPGIAQNISEHLRRMPYNPDVARRIEEEEQNERMVEYLDTVQHYGGGKKKKKNQRGGNLETKTSFDIVRISSHGEFINEPLYDELIKVPRTDTDVKFNIYFRGGIGSTVLTRCNTRDTQLINGKKLCSSFIGRRDFSKNMEITLNSGGISNSIVMGCDTPMVPDMLLTFNDDFVSGFALYKEDGSPLYCNGNYVSLDNFKKDGVEQSEIKLREVLNIIYDELQVKGGEIDIYVSSCLYINPDTLNDIKTNFSDWFECNNTNIITGYKRELSDVYSNINKTEANIQVCNDKQLQKETFVRNSQFLIDVLKNLKEEEGFKDYVFKYLQTEENSIDSLDELINIYLDNTGEPDEDLTDFKLLEESQKISDKIIQMIQKRLSSMENNMNKNKITRYNDDLYIFKINREKLINAIKNCNDSYDIEQPAKRIKRGGKKKDLTYKLKCLEKCKCKRQRVKKKNMKYDMKQLEKNNKCYDKCYNRCFKKTLKKKGGTLNRRHSSAPASIQYTDKLPSQGDFKDIIDDNDAYDEFIRQLATHDDRYSLKSCLELKNYTLANRRSMLDPIVKKHVKKCSKAIVINNFFNFIKEEYDQRPNIGLQIHVTYALERYRQRCIDKECITGDKTNMLYATNMEKVIMESDYYNFSLEVRNIILDVFKKILSNGIDQGYIHNSDDPRVILYSIILFNFVAILINKGLNEFRIIFMGIIQDLQNRLREIDIDEDIIDEVVIKFVKSLYWNKIYI